MKGLKKSAIVLAILGSPMFAQAELKALGDTDMSTVTGQAGLTVEINEAAITIGELNYKDGGNIYMQNTGIVGAGVVQARRGLTVTEGNSWDNITVTIDVAGDAADAANLQSNWSLGKIDNAILVQSADTTGTHGETAVAINDGDLVISMGATDQADMIDFGVYTDKVSLGTSSLGAGDSVSNTGTVLMSNVLATGFMGPIDIVIDGQSNNLNINSYVEIEGEMKLDFVATSFEFALHNRRGNDVLVYDNTVTGESVSYFHAQADIGAAADPSKGLRFNLTDASGDVDFTNIVLGSAPSIGDVYITDLTLKADVNVYGH